MRIAPAPLVLRAAEVEARLRSAQLRLDELLQPRFVGDAGPRLSELDGEERLRLAQEFFFHLVGSVDVLAQVINVARGLGLPSDDVTLHAVASNLSSTDPLRRALDDLDQPTRTRKHGNLPVPPNPYGDRGLIFRAVLYRHSVTHRHVSPFNFVIGGPQSTVHLLLDPRQLSVDPSKQDAAMELRAMATAIGRACRQAIAAL
jgi:hypothetical protein